MDMARIGVDVGGTNTDLVLETDGGVFYHKVPTTLKNQSIGVVEGVRGICELAGIDTSAVETIVHGTTTATNITIEHNGSECGRVCAAWQVNFDFILLRSKVRRYVGSHIAVGPLIQRRVLAFRSACR